MSFVSPLLLAGTALVAVPIVLHLIMRQQPKHLIFPALRFIKQREETNRRQLRLRHLLLLLLRCAGIVLLALALARPSIQASSNFLGEFGNQEAPVAAALVFDTSPRMEYRHQNQTRIEAAQETALWLLSQLPQGSDIGVLDSGSIASVFSVDLGAARQRVERLTATPAAKPLAVVLEEALRLLAESDQARKEVYIFTDLARSAWTGDVGAMLKQRLAELEDVGIYLIDVGVLEPRNFGLGDLKLSAQVLPQSGALQLSLPIQRQGPEEERAIAVYVLDAEGQASKRDQKTIAWKAGESPELEFQFGGLHEGLNQGYVEIAGEDGLPADNTRYFTVDVRPSWQILIAAPRPAVRNARFLKQALAPAGYQKARFSAEVRELDELRDLELDDYAAVCLMDPTPLPPAVWEQLGAYVERGGGLAIWLGRHSQPVGEFNDPAALALLPAPLKRPWSNQDVHLRPEHFDHPVLRKFAGLENVPWQAMPVFKFWQLDELAEGVDVVVAYDNGQPAVTERSIGKGRVLTTTTSLVDEASDLEAWNLLLTGFDSGPYFSLVNEMMAYLIGDPQLNYFVGDTAVLPVNPDWQQLFLTLNTPGGDKLDQSVNLQESTVAVSSTEIPGNYQLEAAGQVRLGFSTNLLGATTLLDRVNEETLKSLFGEQQFHLSRGQENLTREIGLGRVGRELFPYLIFAVALVLAAEHILANRFYRGEAAPVKKATPPASPAQELAQAV